MIKNPFRRTPRVDPEELNKQTAELEAHLEADAPRRNYIASYLNWRGDKNGFGEDFEITLTPRSSS